MMFGRKSEVKEEVKTEPVGARRVVKEWDDAEAKEVYRLYQYELLFLGVYTGPYYGWEVKATGDEVWAKKTAEHYKLEIESE